MSYRTGFFATLLACASFTLPGAGVINSACAYPDSAAATQQAAPNRIQGKVTDIIEAAGYTYAEVDTGKEKVWAATSTTPLKIGDMITFSTEMPMKNFHSNALNRDFPVLYFASRFITARSGPTDTPAAIYSAHEHIKPAPAAKAVVGISKVEGGNTIAEVYADKQKLKGKTIRVRGQVTKYTGNVMGRNWLHIRDSSGADELTVTTTGTAAMDTVVVIEGKLELDRDFGYGYVYPLIVEDASVTTEQKQ
jgi:hypothetical protein